MTLFSKSYNNNYVDSTIGSIGIGNRGGDRADDDCVGRWFSKDDNNQMMSSSSGYEY